MQFRKKITISLFTLLALPMMTTSIANAAATDTDPYVDDGRLSLVRCIKKGNLDFGLFWDSVIYNDNLKEGVVEPWKDILYRNQCQANDIIALIDQQDNLRKTIRHNFLTCNTEELPRLKKTFNELTVEIYYVRHIVDGGLALSLPYDVLSTKNVANSVIKDRTKIYNEMYDNYVKKGVITEEDFNDLFLELEAKYTDRVGNGDEPGVYIICERGSWKEVAEKWDEFKKHFTDDFGGLKSAGETLSSRADEISKDLDKIQITDLVKGDMSFGAYMASFVQVNINNMEAKEGFKEISAGLIKNLPNLSAPSQKDLLNSLTLADKAHNVAALKVEMAANFYVLYRNASDESVKSFLDSLDELIKIIDSSFPLTAQIKGCADTLNSRQCPK